MCEYIDMLHTRHALFILRKVFLRVLLPKPQKMTLDVKVTLTGPQKKFCVRVVTFDFMTTAPLTCQSLVLVSLAYKKGSRAV